MATDDLMTRALEALGDDRVGGAQAEGGGGAGLDDAAGGDAPQLLGLAAAVALVASLVSPATAERLLRSSVAHSSEPSIDSGTTWTRSAT